MPRVTPSYTSVEVTVSKQSGLCEGLRSSQITYEFKVYRSNSLVTTQNVTTSGSTATATLSGLSGATEYRVDIRGIIDVVSQSMLVSETFNTSSGMFDVRIVFFYVHCIVRLSASMQHAMYFYTSGYFINSIIVLLMLQEIFICI